MFLRMGAREQPPGGENGETDAEDISGTTAPSIGPNTTIEREPADERLSCNADGSFSLRSEQSDVDAMGRDKRRQVVGGAYGPTFAKQATLYGGALLITVIVVVGLILLTGELDKAPETNEDKAPWAAPEAEQIQPEPLQ